jgi:hypothetical protein
LTPDVEVVISTYQLCKEAAIHYYLARDLSTRLKVNLAKWKRWSREFLPPDPLGGQQSGFARQYSLRDAFIVALGGFLVGELKFAMPEARIILKELGPWLKRTGYLRLKATLNGGTNSVNLSGLPRDLVFVRPRDTGSGDYLYWVQPLDSDSKTVAAGIGNELEAGEFFAYPGVRVLNLGGFSDHFYSCLKNN